MWTISGSNTSLTQAFLLALQQTLKENDLLNIMPDTNYKAAVSVIERWKNDFPDTYQQFKDKITDSISSFISRLDDYDIKTYEEFERIYPSLTAGSTFNPFVGFDVVQLYESVVQALKPHGYTGIYVIYDEFSKYLEANISEASVSDTKMLQDFAEKCNRSGKNQMHLMLISHKEIANYIDRLPKQKVDGWRGVSERFTHIHLNNNFTQTYEIIATVIQKDQRLWNLFCADHKKEFNALARRYETHRIFSDMQSDSAERTIAACYPLHPVSTFILPRLSERIAQNERTLFTFLSANGQATLPSFLKQYHDNEFSVVTPDLIYDYFEPLFKKEISNGTLHDIYFLTSTILNQLDDDSLEEKLVKTLSLIYMLEQFEKLKPTKDELIGIYSIQHSVPEIEKALNNLIDDEYVIYLKRSNGFLQLKESSGVDVEAKIRDTIASQQSSAVVKKILNASNFDSCIYPFRYNDEKETLDEFQSLGKKLIAEYAQYPAEEFTLQQKKLFKTLAGKVSDISNIMASRKKEMDEIWNDLYDLESLSDLKTIGNRIGALLNAGVPANDRDDFESLRNFIDGFCTDADLFYRMDDDRHLLQETYDQYCKKYETSDADVDVKPLLDKIYSTRVDQLNNLDKQWKKKYLEQNFPGLTVEQLKNWKEEVVRMPGYLTSETIAQIESTAATVNTLLIRKKVDYIVSLINDLNAEERKELLKSLSQN